MSLKHRLIAFIQSQDAPNLRDLNESTSLIKSGLLDSVALLNLSIWIEKEAGLELDMISFDMTEDWDTVASILHFMEHGQVRTAV